MAQQGIMERAFEPNLHCGAPRTIHFELAERDFRSHIYTSDRIMPCAFPRDGVMLVYVCVGGGCHFVACACLQRSVS